MTLRLQKLAHEQSIDVKLALISTRHCVGVCSSETYLTEVFPWCILDVNCRKKFPTLQIHRDVALEAFSGTRPHVLRACAFCSRIFGTAGRSRTAEHKHLASVYREGPITSHRAMPEDFIKLIQNIRH